jgi:Uncharacterised conserved protein (DUF2228)
MTMSTPQRRQELLRELYGFDFPEDFYQFWAFANRLRPLDPLNALHEALGVVLTGPFEVLWGRFDHVTPPLSPYLHWRYYLDPPEFFTVLVGGADGHHWGYYLDDPGRGTRCVACYYHEDDFEMAADGNTLFKAVRLFFEERLAEYDEDREYAESMFGDFEETSARIDKLRQTLQQFATADRPETGSSYVETYGDLRPARFRRVVADTPEGMGIVVPPRLYQPLSLSDKELWRYLQRTDDPDEMIEEARQALHDGYPGTVLKLGKDLWATGWDEAWDLLDAAYAALERPILREILKVHHEHRDRPWLDVLHNDESC